LHDVSALQTIDADARTAANREYGVGLEGLRNGVFDVAEAAFKRAWELSMNIQYMIALGGDCCPNQFWPSAGIFIDWP
jgi:hypothetical protein